jgi:hypothetical protein
MKSTSIVGAVFLLTSLSSFGMNTKMHTDAGKFNIIAIQAVRYANQQRSPQGSPRQENNFLSFNTKDRLNNQISLSRTTDVHPVYGNSNNQYCG